jgi:hypothetical protein
MRDRSLRMVFQLRDRFRFGRAEEIADALSAMLCNRREHELAPIRSRLIGLRVAIAAADFGEYTRTNK